MPSPRRPTLTRLDILIVTTALAMAACEQPAGPLPDPPALASTSPGPSLIECPTNVVRSASTTIHPTGGELTLGGHKVVVPAGAVLVPVTITLSEPISNYMEISVRVNGAEHHEFHIPVTITLSYARCTRSNVDKLKLNVWHIDETTKAFLNNMGGDDDKVARAITFSTGHFSGYVVAE